MEKQAPSQKRSITSSSKTGPVKVGTRDTAAYVATLANQAQNPRKVELPPLDPQADKAMTAVFARMAALYGGLWTAQMKSTNELRTKQAEWFRHFQRVGLNQGDVNDTIDFFAEQQGRDPRKLIPTLPEFIEAGRQCRQVRRMRAQHQASGDNLLIAETEEQIEQRKTAKAKELEERKENAQEGLNMLKAAMARKG